MAAAKSNPRGVRPTPAIVRVQSKCVQEDHGFATLCHVFTGCRDQNGYGTIGTGSRSDGTRRLRRAHHVTWEHRNGPVPEGMQLDHLCRVPSCVNPDHLDPVTPRENTRRGLHGVLKTHCGNGHRLAGHNLRLVITSDWRVQRICRTCRRRRDRERKGILV